MKLKEKFDSIDQSKLNADQKDFLSKIEKATKNFTSDNKEVNDKVEGALDKMIATFKEKMPEAIKTKAIKKAPKASAKKASAKPSQTSNPKRTVMSVAKEIRKDGESWADAQKRARAEMKKDKESATKEVKTEMDKLLAFIKTRKELDGIGGTDLKRDSAREAKPRGRRISKDGNVYYENRENRIDRLAPNYPKDAPMLAGGGDVGKKLYYERMNVGKAKYTVNYHDGVKTHKDGSAFYDIAIFKNKKDLQDFISKLSKEGYKERSSFYAKGGYVAVTETKDDYWVIVSRPTSKKMAEEMAKIVTTQKDEKNKVVTLAQAKAHKKVLGKEYLDKFELGGNVGGYDLAGHLGGNFNVAQNDGLLDGTTGTQYSGLVGETGAMSAGEMFENGGGVDDDDDYTYRDFYWGQGGMKFKTVEEAEEFIKLGKPFVRKQLREGNMALVYNGKEYFIGEKVKYNDEEYRKGGALTNDRRHVNYSQDYEVRYSKNNPDKKRHGYGGMKFEDGGDFQAGVYANGGKITKSEVMANMYKPSGDYYLEQSGNDMIVHLTSRDAGNSIVSLENKFDVKDNGKGYHGSSYILSRKKYAEGGGLGVHGLKEGDQILKTLSGGVQKIKDKKGDIVYVNLANGERSSEAPLPFNDGGKVPEFIVNKDGIRVSKMVEPKKKLSEKEWMAKHSESKEARAYKYGGKLDGYSEFIQYEFPKAKREANKYSKKYKVPYIVVVEKNNQDRIGVRTLRDFLSFPKSYQESYDVLYETKVDYEHGGNLETNIKSRLAKNFNLPLEVAVYVPSTKDADEAISEEEFESRVESVQKYLSDLFGGFSSNDVDGGYMSQEKGLITEEVYKVISFAQRDGFSSKMEKLVVQIKKWAKDWEQESIGLEFEGDLFYIDQKGNYAEGGEINAFSMRMVKGTNSKPDEVLTENQEVKFAKGGLITEEKLKEEEWFSPDGKVQFEYIQGRLRITLYYGKNRQYSTRTTINNASELSLKELNEQVKKEISHLKEFAERDLKRNFAGGGQVEKRQAYLDTLADKEADIWDKLGAESGGEIRQDKDMLRNYALKMEAMLKREEVGKGSFDEADYDYFQDMNAHLMNEFLVWNNYYEPEMTVREKKWRTEKFPDSKYRNYVSDPKVISLSDSNTDKADKYIVHADIKFVTVEKNGKELKFKGSDVLNGANILKNGGELSESATYYPKRSIVSVELKDGKKIKPSNGYWIKKNASEIKVEKEYKVKSNVGIFPKKGTQTYWYVENSKGQTINRHTDKPYRGKEMDNYIFYTERNAESFAQRLNMSSSFENGGKVSFAEKSKAIAKNFEGKRVEPKYQKEYGKAYNAKEAKEVGDKIAGAQKAKYDAKAEKGAVVKKKVGNPNAGSAMILAKKIRKDGEKWTDALKRANAMIKNK